MFEVEGIENSRALKWEGGWFRERKVSVAEIGNVVLGQAIRS